MKRVYQAILNALGAGAPVALVSVVEAKGSAPRRAGALMAVFSDGRAMGTVGGGAVEHAARALAREIIKGPVGPARLRDYSLTRNDAAGLGMICGGDVKLLFHPIGPGDAGAIEVFAGIIAALDGRAPRWLARVVRQDGSVQMALYGEEGLITGEQLSPGLALGGAANFSWDAKCARFVEPVSRAGRAILFGGGHVSRALSPLLASVGFPVFVFDDRAEFADVRDFPGAEAAALCRFSDFSDAVEIGPQDFVVIVTRGHQADYEVLRQALKSSAVYIGMIGSRAKIRATKERLRAEGFSEEQLARTHAPIGLKIGAETPAEIAVSIAAEMIQMRAEAVAPSSD